MLERERATGGIGNITTGKVRTFWKVRSYLVLQSYAIELMIRVKYVLRPHREPRLPIASIVYLMSTAGLDCENGVNE